MFQEVIDALKALWKYIIMCRVVYEHEKGFVYRWGLHQRDIEPGLRWKWPLMEEFKVSTIQDDIKTLPNQTLTTQDAVQLVVTPIISYKVKNVHKYYKTVYSDNDNIVDDITAGVVRDYVKNKTYQQLLSGDIEKEIVKDVRKLAGSYGLWVHGVKFSTFARIRTIRLINDTPPLE